MSTESKCLEHACPICCDTHILVFLEVAGLPVNCNLLWAARDEALLAPRGAIALGFCRRCGHVFNLAFEPELMEYNQEYENSLHCSPRFQQYARALAERLIARYDLHNKEIVEIGCGNGEFLRMLCELGDNRGFGFDPSYVPSPDVVDDRVTFIPAYYSERFAHHQADLICCRHVLEHIDAPREFIAQVRRAIGARADTTAFFEVPNMAFTLRELAIWDIIYPHCSYYTAGSLAYLFGSSGFVVRDLAETFGGQFLTVEAQPLGRSAQPASIERDTTALAQSVAAFADDYRQKVEHWQHIFGQLAAQRRRAVVWGAGAKGVTFLNALDQRGQIEYVVDINPRKHGMYMAGTGQQIVGPEFLRDYRPDVVIVMNPIYEQEIRQIASNVGVSVESICA